MFVSCFFIHPATLCLLIGEFTPFTFRVIIGKWGLTTAILSFVFWFLYITVVAFSLYFSLSSWFGGFLWFFFSFLLFYVYCLCSRFMFCGYHEVCIKRLVDKMVLFLLIASYLHLPIGFLTFSPSPSAFLLSQIIPFHVVSLLPNWSSYNYFFWFSPFNLYAIIKCLIPILIKSYNFLILCITLLTVLCPFTFSFLVKDLLSTFLVRHI